MEELERGKYYTVVENNLTFIKFMDMDGNFKHIAIIPDYYECKNCIADTITGILNMNEVRMNLNYKNG